MDSESNIWSVPLVVDGKTEPKGAFQLFKVYLRLGLKRRFEDVAIETGKSLSHLYNLSNRWKWSDRVNAYDSYESERLEREQEELRREKTLLADKVAIEGLKIYKEFLDSKPPFDGLKVKDAVDVSAKHCIKESAVELDVKKRSNISLEEIGAEFDRAFNNDGE